MKRPEKRVNLDYVLLIVLAILIIAGLVLLYSTSAYNGQNKFQDAYYYVKKQGAATILGVIGMFIVAKIDYHKWIPFANLGYLVSIILSVLVMLVGEEYNGSKRWLSLGPLSFQPSEFSKVAIILFLACLISGQKKCVDNWRSMLLLLLPVLPVTALVGASNLSTAIIILGIAVVLIFVASPKYIQFIWMGVLGIGFMAIFLAIVWKDWQYGEIRNNTKKDIRHYKDYMQSVRADCSEEDLVKVFKSLDSCQKHKMT